MQRFCAALCLLVIGLHSTAGAEVVDASATYYRLRHEATSSRSPDALWQRLVDPASWWHPDHTYSGDATNLSLDLRPGGLWLETWDGGAVAHGEVLLVQRGKTLRLNAPFGPLQGIGAYTIWTITIEPSEEGSLVVFDEVSTAPDPANMTELAKAVDFVKTEAITRLVAD
jgi:uncharacterized protein YndB with AHSA1/START domain